MAAPSYTSYTEEQLYAMIRASQVRVVEAFAREMLGPVSATTDPDFYEERLRDLTESILRESEGKYARCAKAMAEEFAACAPVHREYLAAQAEAALSNRDYSLHGPSVVASQGAPPQDQAAQPNTDLDGDLLPALLRLERPTRRRPKPSWKREEKKIPRKALEALHRARAPKA